MVKKEKLSKADHYLGKMGVPTIADGFETFPTVLPTQERHDTDESVVTLEDYLEVMSDNFDALVTSLEERDSRVSDMATLITRVRSDMSEIKSQLLVFKASAILVSNVLVKITQRFGDGSDGFEDLIQQAKLSQSMLSLDVGHVQHGDSRDDNH